MKWFLKFITSVFVLMLGACTSLVPSPPGSAPTQTAANQAWQEVLSRHVNNQGEVSFSALAKEPSRIETVIRHIAVTDYEKIAEPLERLTYLINSYNALSMYNVIASDIPDSHFGWNKVKFFVLRRFQIGQSVLSLYALENNVIRPLANQLGLPEIHFALNCSARSCPQLPQLPFSAANLRQELNREAKLFFARAENWRVDDEKKMVFLNEILQFYTEDFIPAHGKNLIDYANRYVVKPAPLDFRISFVPYDWRIANSAVK
jgi:Protein of unknown function, DUF547